VPDIVRSDLLHGDNAALLLLTLLILTAFLLLAWIGTALRLRTLNRRFNSLARGADGHNLEQILVTHMDVVARAEQRMEAIEQAVALLQAQIPSCLQRVHLIRYDAFEDVGGEQSFSAALLDAKGDGVVLTSVYSRSDVRVYAKAIQNGRASHALSREEERALREVVLR
jgi:hypothetical protein